MEFTPCTNHLTLTFFSKTARSMLTTTLHRYYKLPLISPGLIQLQGFRSAYKWGEEEFISEGIYNRTKESLKKSKIAVIKILFEFTRFFKLQNVVKN